jgi:uncharacterized Fe-S cluster protein YjdI
MSSESKPRPTVTPSPDGPYLVRNLESFASRKGAIETKPTMALCRGKSITIHDNRGICAHAGRCTDGLASVFRLKQEPWIDPDGAKREAIIATIRQCPSGALSYSIDGVERGGETGEAAIFVAPDGPYAVRGGVDLVDTPRGEGASTQHYTLCRCGGSKNRSVTAPTGTRSSRTTGIDRP